MHHFCHEILSKSVRETLTAYGNAVGEFPELSLEIIVPSFL